MRKKFLPFAFIATLLLTGISFTSCSDDDDDVPYYNLESTITFENRVAVKEFVQSGTIAIEGQDNILPGQSVQIRFNAARGQNLMFAMMFGNSNDLFFAPDNPGLQLFDANGVGITADVSNQIHLWDNGTRVNEQPSASLVHPGVAEDGTIGKIETEDSHGNLYRPASELVRLNLAYDAVTSEFTLTITNNSTGTINETPLSHGVWVVSNVIDDELVSGEPFFIEGSKSSAQLTALAERGDNAPLASMVQGMTGIITNLSPVVVVVYTGDINPLYTLNERDANLGLKDLAQQGTPTRLKESLEGMANVRQVYVLGADMLQPGKNFETTYRAMNGDRIAYATMFGYANDWFYTNSETIPADFKGDLTSRTVLLDNGTGVNQYPGAGNNQALFGGTPQAENNPITRVDTSFPIPELANVIRVTIR